ncbi:MAG: YdcF family protein [Microcoleus sp. PH2017_01_SCD_O_A]|uniref:YdcF family protein n=1 Tax=unclassified Microcoleus TaxID=2642155 RepID=UPI001DD95468|nr:MULTISPECIES: YdcF family protein [unclassified Microcoleus]MCC3421233.1 YdcF family protein [Microcoleus sp. PH2017_07_MST_O_A]MCC3505191.1 YdcF family protein [Microcoleus sp. PH2017_19_SFW_U_A]MCC3510181.1 YdcF family protein [Microcoleus sp. PH2017_17_BER_D_A]TAE52336.1 MAG: YdcF family protein [Oscillatoriales cyanobacterium]MCC3422901.1 YdcF family protein [Microcoleus sp. PH2017_01_SCD_O_A]
MKIRLIRRREMWAITWEGWVIAIAGLIITMVLIITNIHPFLAVNAPIKADILVVEGWLPDYAVESAIAEFNKGGYRKLVTTGLPVSKGHYLAQYKNYAELTAATCIALGFDKNKVVAVPAPSVVKHRTAASAIALRDWLATSALKVDSINLYSIGTHARRSWMVFKEVLNPEIKVGIIAAESEDYNSQEWWKSSAGFRTVTGEIIAYIYARFVNWKA